MQTIIEDWPPLPVSAWADTYVTLHMWMQIVGKIRLALAPPVNHWWHVALYVTARGLTTSPIPYRGEAFEIAFDFIDHKLTVETTGGERREIALAPQSVAAFYRRLMTALKDLRIDVRVWPVAVEIPTPIRLDRDEDHASYDAEFANRFWRVLVSTDAVFKEFRGRFLGKCSPVHFFWGGPDLAVTRFNGRRTDAKAQADAMNREAYSHEVISAGFWPGRLGAPGGFDAVFYAYSVPEPDGFRNARVGPAAARYDTELGEFLLPYDAVRAAASPRETLLEFLQTTYEAAARGRGWNRAELERV